MNSRTKKIIRCTIFTFLLIITSILGIYQVLKEKEKYQDYETVVGAYVSSSVYSRDDDGATYSLTYKYYVNGTSYQVNTNYGTSFVPKEGTPRKIRYHKENPQQAKIVGVELSEWCFLIILICLIASSYSFQSLMDLKGQKKNNRWDYINLIMVGIGLIYATSIIYALITGTKNLFSIFDMLSSYGLSLIIIFIFIAVGIYLIGYSIYSFFPKKKKVKKDSFELEQEKLRREELEQNFENFIEKSAVVSSYATITIRLIVSFIMLFCLIYFFYFKITNLDVTVFLISLPFTVVFFAITILTLLDFLSLFLKNSKQLSFIGKIRNIFSYLPVIAFLTFWFGFLIIMSVIAIISKTYSLCFFSIPFWLAGIFAAKIFFKKKK